MRFDDRVQAYADKLLTQSQKKIEADHKKNIEAVFLGLSGRLVPHMMHDLVEAYVERIRRLGQARMESLITAHKDAEIPLDKDIIHEIKNQVISLCHNEQDDVYNRIPRLTPPVGATLVVDDNASTQIVDGVDSVMGDLSLDLDITSDKIGLAEETRKKIYGAATGKRWDAFISHASEDKEGFVRPLADALEKSGLEIWFDETTLKVGDRLREAIDHGLSKSRYGIVVLSKHFFLKDWTKEELEGLTTKEIGGVKVILPVWHNVTRDEVAKHSPTLAGRLAARSQDGLEKVVRQLREAMGKESPKPLESPKKNGLTLKKAPTSAPAPHTALNAEHSQVTNSPVAAGSGINQNVNAPVINVNVGQPAAPPAQLERFRHILLPHYPPNIIVTGAHIASVSQVGQGVWSESHPMQDAFIVQFTNEARRSGPNVEGQVKAQLVYRDGVRELRRVTGCWLNQAADMTEFRVDDTHGLMVGLMLGERFNIVGKRRIRVDLNTEEIPQDIIPLHGFGQGIVSVRLTHVDTGEFLYEGQFQLNTRPPEIIRL